jgi:hypothetical protein
MFRVPVFFVEGQYAVPFLITANDMQACKVSRFESNAGVSLAQGILYEYNHDTIREECRLQ